MCARRADDGSSWADLSTSGYGFARPSSLVGLCTMLTFRLCDGVWLLRRLFGPRTLVMPADFWLGLQTDWDLWHAMRSDGAEEIDALVPMHIDAKA